MIISTVAMILVVLIVRKLYPLNVHSRLSCVLYITINALLGGLTYFVIAFKQGILEKILGKRMTNKILKIVTLGKVQV